MRKTLLFFQPPPMRFFVSEQPKSQPTYGMVPIDFLAACADKLPLALA